MRANVRQLIFIATRHLMRTYRFPISFDKFGPCGKQARQDLINMPIRRKQQTKEKGAKEKRIKEK